MSRSILFILGVLLVCVSFTMLAPLLLAVAGGEAAAATGLWQALLLVAGTGGALALIFQRRDSAAITHREGLAAVGLCWAAACVAGGLPFVLAGHLSFTDAVFEAASGFTTTGATILADIEVVPRSLLLWRSLTHWLGGMGIIVLSLAVQPLLGVGGMQLYRAEVPGPSPDKLTPRIQDTAKFLWGVYVLLTVVEIILLLIGGMDLFDAVNHTFATMATGGFSTRNASLAAFPAPFIQWVIIVFMFAAGMNFTLHFRALRGQPGEYFKSAEWKTYVGVVAASSVLIMAFLATRGVMPLETPAQWENMIRAAVFQVVSIITTTGFVTENYALWPSICVFILLLLTFLGGCAGSTGGGFKVMRLTILARMAALELLRVLHPRSVRHIKLDGRTVASDVVAGIIGFLLIYLFLVITGTVLLTALRLDLLTAFSAVLTCISNVGPGLGLVGPVDNFSHLPTAVKWILSLLMLLGRLEFHALLLLFMPDFWRRD